MRATLKQIIALSSKPRLRRLPRRLAGIAVFAGILLGGLEAGLRAFPGELIPMSWLKRFQSDLRVEIAERLALPNENQMWELPRDDDGPPLQLYRPHARPGQIFAAADGAAADGEVVRDAQGFCNPPRDRYDRLSIDVVVLGDSFAECIAADPAATWASRIGELTGLSVYNLGKGGIGPYDYLQVFRHFGLPKDPGIVVMSVYEGNDLRDSVRYHDHVAAVRGGGSGYADAADRFEPEIDYQALLDRPLVRRSYALNAGAVALGKAREGIGNAVARAAGKRRERINFRYALRFDDTVVPFNVQNTDHAEVRYARRLRRGEVELNAMEAALERFVELGDEHGFVPVIAYAPSAYTAYADYVAFEDEALATLMPWFSATQRAWLRDKTEFLEVAFLDLTEPLQAGARRLQAEDLLYDPAHVHYTPSGHRLVGDALAAAIEELRGAAPQGGDES